MTRSIEAVQVAELLPTEGFHREASVVYLLLAENAELRAMASAAPEATPERSELTPKDLLLIDRVRHVKRYHSSWDDRKLSYNDIRRALRLSGAEVIKPIYAALYRPQSSEYRLARNA